MQLLVRERTYVGGIQKLYRFENEYGASVIKGEGTYGFSEGLWELAVIRFTGKDMDSFDIVYDTPITGDVIGYLTETEVNDLLTRIENLK